MNTATPAPQTEAEVWMRIMYPERELTPKVAQAILQLTFPSHDLGQMNELSAKARAGTLTAEEDRAMDAFERAGAILSILKSKARRVLRPAAR